MSPRAAAAPRRRACALHGPCRGTPGCRNAESAAGQRPPRPPILGGAGRQRAVGGDGPPSAPDSGGSTTVPPWRMWRWVRLPSRHAVRGRPAPPRIGGPGGRCPAAHRPVHCRRLAGDRLPSGDARGAPVIASTPDPSAPPPPDTALVDEARARAEEVLLANGSELGLLGGGGGAY